MLYLLVGKILCRGAVAAARVMEISSKRAEQLDDDDDIIAIAAPSFLPPKTIKAFLKDINITLDKFHLSPGGTVQRAIEGSRYMIYLSHISKEKYKRCP